MWSRIERGVGLQRRRCRCKRRFVPRWQFVALLLVALANCCDMVDGQAYIGQDTYREGYAGGEIKNLAIYPEQVTIIESSRFLKPTDKKPEESTTINLALFIIDGDLRTGWWGARDEFESWIEIYLGSPIQRIKDEESREFFKWKYEEEMQAGEDIEYLEDGLTGFHVDQVVISWYGWYASSDYKLSSSMDRIQWKDRRVRQEMPTVYDRVDKIEGWSQLGVGNTRYVKLTMVERVIPKDETGYGNGRRAFEEKTTYGIREIEVFGPEPSTATALRISWAVPLAFLGLLLLWF